MNQDEILVRLRALVREFISCGRKYKKQSRRCGKRGLHYMEVSYNSYSLAYMRSARKAYTLWKEIKGE